MKKRRIIPGALVSITLALLAACPLSDGGDNGGDDTTGETSSGEIDLFAAGWLVDDQSVIRAFRWEAMIDADGEITSRQAVVPEPTILSDVEDAYGMAITLSGDSVVAVGYYCPPETDERWPSGTYPVAPWIWTDDTWNELELPDDGATYTGTAVAVDAGSVHAAGWVQNIDTYEMRPCHWQDGVIHVLQDVPEGVTVCDALDVRYVSGDGLYILGRYRASPPEMTVVPCYWVVNGEGNDTRHDLELPEEGTATATGLFVDGTDVYASGYYYVLGEGSPYVETACYWKNGALSEVQAGTAEQQIAQARSIVVVGGDVYLAGGTGIYDEEIGLPSQTWARVWVNGEGTDLSAEDSWASDLDAVGDYLVVSGYTADGGDRVAALWLAQQAAAQAAAVTSREFDVDGAVLYLLYRGLGFQVSVVEGVRGRQRS